MSNQSRKKNISTIIILAIVLLVPGFLYLALNKIGSNEYVKLPTFGEKVLSGKVNRKMGREIADTTFHQVKPIALFNSQREPSDFLKSDSVISIVHLFYSKDLGLSKTLFQGLSNVAKRFDYNRKVRFYSISIDTTDTSVELSEVYEQYVNGATPYWTVVGSNRDILTYVRENFLIDAMRDPNDPTKFLFSNNYVLLDSERRIRGFYDINLKTELERLEDEIKVQLVEEARNNPFKIEKK